MPEKILVIASLVMVPGGTCDISAWDAFYLAMFWMLNTIGCSTGIGNTWQFGVVSRSI
jgi:hypothetical protein